MESTGLFQRLKDAFFPSSKVTKKMTILRSYPGTEDEFFDYLERHGFESSVALAENNPRVTVYNDPVTGEPFAMCVRWPNRNYYYTYVVA